MAKPMARALARFKQLSCLGLGGEAIMPALLTELHAIIPSMRSMFFFANRQGALSHLYTEAVEHARITQLFVREFNGRPDREPPGFGFNDAMRSQVGVFDLAAMRVDERAFGRSAFYNELFRPVGRGTDYIRLVMRDRGRGLGMLTTFRSIGARHFSEEEKRRLAGLEPFFVHALTDHAAADGRLVESGLSGIIIATADGRPLSFSATGRQLLFRAMTPLISRRDGGLDWDILPPPLQQICRDLGKVFANDEAAMPPAYFHRNALGGFSFRAHWLNGTETADGHVAIVVSFQEPLSVRLVRRVGDLPLSPRQAEVCVLLARGLLLDEIAARLGISRNTANEHSRWVYHRLGVHNRAELSSKLLDG